MGRERHLIWVTHFLWAALAVWVVGATAGAITLQSDGRDGGSMEDLLGGALVGSIPAGVPLLLAVIFLALYLIEPPKPWLEPSSKQRPLRSRGRTGR